MLEPWEIEEEVSNPGNETPFLQRFLSQTFDDKHYCTDPLG